MSYTRRNFLRHTGVAGLAATQLGWFANGAQANAQQDYCAMVCILLAGGADSFNMLLPYDQDRYDQYATIRADLALERAAVTPLNYLGAGGARFAVHPGLAEVAQLFENGDLAFVANVGPLAEPTTRAALDAGTARLPLGLFSHSDQIAVWQTAAAGERVSTGFGGRVADFLSGQYNTGPVSMNISMSGTNLFQTGTQTASYAIDSDEGVRSVAGYENTDTDVFTRSLDRLLALDYADPFRQTYAQQLRGSIDAGQELAAALQTAPPLQTVFSEGGLSEALQQVARVISARNLLGAQRQTFFVTIGGWDHHDEVLNNQANMLPGISRGLSEFHAALVEMGLLDAVTTFTISDFGRTLTSNGRGSDHGWGGNSLVMGGSVNGGVIYGDYPELVAGTELDLGRGRFLPTTSVDELYAELGLWYGIAGNDLDMVLPNIGRFYAPGDPAPLGLMV